MRKVIEIFKSLPKGKQEFAFRMIEDAEGRWGSLAYTENREILYEVMKHGISKEFYEAFKKDMEDKWNFAVEEFEEGETLSKLGLKPYHLPLIRAEVAFRDFHYEYQDVILGER